MFKRGYKRRAYGKRKSVVGKRRWASRKKPRQLVTKPMLYRAIRRNEEVKVAINAYPITTFNSAIASSGDAIILLPPISRGTDQNQRIGSKIKPVKMIIRGFVTYNTLNGTAYQVEAHMLGARLFVYSNKTTAAASNSIYDYTLLDNGGSGAAFSGAAIDFHAPHNKDTFKFYADKRMIINKPYGWTDQIAGGGTGSSTNSITSYNSSMYHPFTVVLKAKDMPANLIFDEAESSTFPVNFNPLMSLGYCHILNTAPDTTVQLLAMQFVAELHYTDA